MKFLSTILFAATALATGNLLHFVNQDSTQRTVVFTASEGLEQIPDLVIPGLQTANQSIPDDWIGNCYSVSEGAPNVPGMLAEFSFNAFAGATYFDVSAIVNPGDNVGVKMIYPLGSNTPLSGCQRFPCENAYNTPDDIATLSSDETEFAVLLGTLSNSRVRRGVVAVERSNDEAIVKRVSHDLVIA